MNPFTATAIMSLAVICSWYLFSWPRLLCLAAGVVGGSIERSERLEYIFEYTHKQINVHSYTGYKFEEPKDPIVTILEAQDQINYKYGSGFVNTHSFYVGVKFSALTFVEARVGRDSHHLAHEPILSMLWSLRVLL